MVRNSLVVSEPKKFLGPGDFPQAFFIGILCLVGALSFSILSFRTSSSDLGGYRFIPPKDIDHLVQGNRSVAADSIWIGLIQDFSYCEREVAKQRCAAQGWAFQMAMAVSHLDPSFRDLHFIAPLMLTIVVNDIEGASALFDRAVELFPTDWNILYSASYQALIEEKNQLKAGNLMLRAAKNGAPRWLYEAAHKALLKGGNRQDAEEILESMEKSGLLTPPMIDRMKQRAQQSQ